MNIGVVHVASQIAHELEKAKIPVDASGGIAGKNLILEGYAQGNSQKYLENLAISHPLVQIDLRFRQEKDGLYYAYSIKDTTT